MKLSEAGRKFIQHFEQLRLTAYPDGKYWSIGWGHNGPDVKPGMKITKARANELFEKDIEWAEKAVSALVKVPLTEREFDSLVSFVYTIGKPQLRDSTLLARLNRGERIPAADHLLRWIHQDGKVVPGLIKRRHAEKKLFQGFDIDKAIKAGEEAYETYNERLQGSRD